MKTYHILRNPGHNQVYFKHSAHLCEKELLLSGLPLKNVQETVLGGLPYLSFQKEADLETPQLEVLSRLSFLYGLFQAEGQLLAPMSLPDPQILDRSITSILKYSGKTNEIFTRFLLNLALSQINAPLSQVKLLDPVAGRGTTLFDALSLGASAYGIELQEKSVSEGYQHLKKFLELEKIKHKTNTIRFSGPEKRFTAKRYSIQLESQQFELICSDSKEAKALFPKETFHIILGDLPYGIQHGNHSGKLQRSPAQLLSTCAPSWREVLKPQGVLLLSWNTLVFSRAKMEETLAQAGFQILKNDHLLALAHQVDASILRDVVLAKKS